MDWLTPYLPTGSPAEWLAFAQVLLIDISLAGDNAVVVGLAAASLPPAQQTRALVIGIGAATLLRILLALLAVQLLAIIGLTLAGGLLLLWVCWKMARELREPPHTPGTQPRKTLRAAMLQIMAADLSMSLDNVLAVAGAARGHLWVLVAGLLLSILLTALAARLLMRLLARWRWIAWLGLAVVLFVALRMIWEGSHEVLAWWHARAPAH
jgi:YjbE family integral membrane protein